MNQITEQLRIELNKWKKLSEEMREELKLLPIGSAVIKKINSKKYLYHQYRIDKKQYFKYINHNKEELIDKLIRKDFIKKSLPIIDHNIMVIEKTVYKLWDYDCEKIYKKIESKLDKKYLNRGIIYRDNELLRYRGSESRVKQWLNEKEDSRANITYANHLKHTTFKGKKVRSKSEVIIAGNLENRGIAYKYEEPIVLDGIIFRPDFVVMRPSDLKLIYWEHFGLTGDKKYLRGMSEKLQIFASHEITLWDNLIITFDTPEGIIDGSRISQIMDLYGL